MGKWRFIEGCGKEKVAKGCSRVGLGGSDHGGGGCGGGGHTCGSGGTSCGRGRDVGDGGNQIIESFKSANLINFSN